MLRAASLTFISAAKRQQINSPVFFFPPLFFPFSAGSPGEFKRAVCLYA